MLRDLRIDQLSEVSFEPLVRALIRAHKPRVTRHIGGKNCRELPFDGVCVQRSAPQPGVYTDLV